MIAGPRTGLIVSHAALPRGHTGTIARFQRVVRWNDRDRWRKRFHSRTILPSRVTESKVPLCIRPEGRRAEEDLRVMRTFRNFLANESGATAIEYGLIAAGISIAIIAVVQSLGSSLNTTFTSVQTALK
jgi:pilus assembly protein Flp/PilA